MGVFMGRTGDIDEWVISHRHGIVVLALLQGLLICTFGDTISATRYHVDKVAELHRSMARYRQLREFENSEHDTIKVDEKMMTGRGEEELNLTEVDQQQEDGLEKDVVQESVVEFDNSFQMYSELRQQEGALEKYVVHETNVERPTVETPNDTVYFDQQQRGGLEKEIEQQSGTMEQIKEPTAEISIDNPEPDQEQRRGLDHELNTKEQQQEEARKRPKEGNIKKEEPFVFPEPYLLGPTIKDWDEQRSSWLEENPHMISTLNKPRVLIVTGSQPESCVSPVGDDVHIKSFKLKIDYARMHGFEIYYNLVWLDPLFGGWWAKLPTLRKLMLTHPEIEWFFWVDSDAVFTDMLFEPPFHTYEGYNMVMWGWEHGLFTNRSWVAFNAGVFLMRNTQWSLDLIDKWSPMGPKGPVRDEYGKILTSFLSFRKDNFSSDDQSALAYLMITDEAVRSKVKLVDSDTYTMSGFWIEVVETYEDCTEKYHPGLGDKRWPWITHFTGCGFCAGGDNPDYAYERCMEAFGRAYNFADNQVLAYMGFQHRNLSSEVVFRTRNDTGFPIEFVGVSPWDDRIALVAAQADESLNDRG